jgi:succinate dehydrogenase/fumarate reductase flavoprotein subunit
MTQGRARVRGLTVPVHSLNTLVIGSGAAALNAAVRLHDEGQADLAVLTERWTGGASRNAGSDKQTYYKLSLAGDVPDSPFEMAKDLAAGGSMDGPVALCEALNSLPAFFHLVRLGVPFPHDAFGAYVGYKTDHDPRQRATSAGPLTSRLMWEALARAAARKKIRTFDRHQAVSLLTARGVGGRKVIGAVAIDLARSRRRTAGVVLFNAVNVVLATGGPAGIYRDSAYPQGQTGSHGLAFEAGALARNLTESQFGLASLKPRWNLSGSYQQVIPRYFSTDRRGGSAREFLSDHFPDMATLAAAIFRKGYEWPFDPRKVRGCGSSLIDLLVYRERVALGRRVFLDFTRNPAGGGRLEDFSLDLLGGEARTYLANSGALATTPIERLRRLNPPAIALFRARGVDLGREPLEVGVCAQHNNGGFKGNIWWESNVRRLFPVGEVNGSHGVTRPGGSALNAGQVGSQRAALYIARRCGDRPPSLRAFLALAGPRLVETLGFLESVRGRRPGPGRLTPKTALAEIRERMSSCGALVRDPGEVERERRKAWALVDRVSRELALPAGTPVATAFRLKDLALTHAVYLEAIAEYLAKGGRSRGSYLVPDPKGAKPCPTLEDRWRFRLGRPGDAPNRRILEVGLDEKRRVRKTWAPVRSLPRPDAWFETVWGDFRAGRVIKEDR